MEFNFVMLACTSLLALTVLTVSVAFVIARWRDQNRVSRVNDWVNHYLRQRYGELPAHLWIDCSPDEFWPVLVSFDTSDVRIRHKVQFACKGPTRMWSLLSEKDERV